MKPMTGRNRVELMFLPECGSDGTNGGVIDGKAGEVGRNTSDQG